MSHFAIVGVFASFEQHRGKNKHVHSHSNPVQPMTPRGVRTMDAAARKLRVANFKYRDTDFFLICQVER
ncbi:hypothetical protein BVIET440_380008 [Burkholderia vietnamiensis]|nr:hypothetical protein C2U71_16445 [Burkholderia ubonensis]